MEEARTYLEKLADIVAPEVQVDKMYQQIHEVVSML
jgi:hypothetical protein